MAIKFASRADLHHLRRFMEGKQADVPQDAVQVLDIVLRELSNQRWPFFLFIMTACLALALGF